MKWSAQGLLTGCSASLQTRTLRIVLTRNTEAILCRRRLHLTTFRIGTPPEPGQGLRIGATRRPPRGVPKDRWVADGYFDVWLPALAPSAKLSAEILKRLAWPDSRAFRKAFCDRYERELLSHRRVTPDGRIRRAGRRAHAHQLLAASARMSRAATARASSRSSRSTRPKHDPRRHHRRHARRAQAARARLAAPTRDGIHFWAQRNEEEEWIAACAGAGQAAATRAFAAIEDGGPIDLVFSVGWAGALRAEIAAGSAHNVAGVIDVRTGERFQLRRRRRRSLAGHQPQGCRRAEKRRLASAYNAALVDMEAAAIARLAAMRGIPFYASRASATALTDRLPDFNRFLSPDGQFRLAGLLFLPPLRPWYWPALIRMGENSRKASQSIAESLRRFSRGQLHDE